MANPNHPNQQILFFSMLVICAALSVLFIMPSPFASAAPLSDAEKNRRVMVMYADYRKDFPEVEDIDAKNAMGMLPDPEVVFVDVRKPEEQAISMIPGAITEKQFMGHLNRYRSNRIIVYCTISFRSGKLAAKLQNEGISVTNLKGGLLGWVHAGGPLVRQNQPVQELHVYGRKWDLAPDGIKTVY